MLPVQFPALFPVQFPIPFPVDLATALSNPSFVASKEPDPK